MENIKRDVILLCGEQEVSLEFLLVNMICIDLIRAITQLHKEFPCLLFYCQKPRREPIKPNNFL